MSNYMMYMKKNTAERIHMINNETLTPTYRTYFDFHWDEVGLVGCHECAVWHCHVKDRPKNASIRFLQEFMFLTWEIIETNADKLETQQRVV